jgi:hypothetical protein
LGLLEEHWVVDDPTHLLSMVGKMIDHAANGEVAKGEE